MKTTTLAFALILLFAGSYCFAQTTIVMVVRHAEKQAGQGDVSLTEAGAVRARELGTIAKALGVSSVYHTRFKRSLETAQPTADVATPVITPILYDEPTTEWAESVLKSKPRAVLIVGHSNTIPQIVERFGGGTVNVGENEFDKLIILQVDGTQDVGTKMPMVQLTYGASTSAPSSFEIKPQANQPSDKLNGSFAADIAGLPNSELVRRNPPEIDPPVGNLYSHSVEIPAGYRTLFISGQVGEKDGKVPNEVDKEVDQAWDNVIKNLQSAGMSIDDLVKVTCFISEDKYKGEYAASIERKLGKDQPGQPAKNRPAMTAPIVRQLWKEAWHFEIEAVAARARDQRPSEAANSANQFFVPGATFGVNGNGPDAIRNLYQDQDRKERIQEEERFRQFGPGKRDNKKPLNRPKGADLVPQVSAAFTSRQSSLKPTTVYSKNGRLQVTLDLNYNTYTIGKDQVRLRTYQWKEDGEGKATHSPEMVGPVLRVQAGDVLAITLINSLPASYVPPHADNGHHEWNTTNLHFHGLHVAPQGPRGQPDQESDNVLLELKPSDPVTRKGSVQKYEVHIPADHPAGTFWYHAHKHGSVAAQVSSGMAGALIVERRSPEKLNNLDAVPQIKAAAEEVMVIQQIPYLSNAAFDLGGIEPLSPNVIDGLFGPTRWGVLQRYATVNGQLLPTIEIAPGEVRRLRLIASAQRELMTLQIERPNDPGTVSPIIFHEIALDGLPTGTIQPRDTIELYPGYRIDALIRAPLDAAGEYYLVDDLKDVNGQRILLTGADGSDQPVRRIARIVVSGKPVAMDLPRAEDLRDCRREDISADSEEETPQYAFYGISFPPAQRPIFLISRDNLSEVTTPVNDQNAHAYPAGQPRRLTLGKTERWLVGSRNGILPPGTGPLKVTHPFHIHTNAFLITKVMDYNTSPAVDVTERELGHKSVWRDTLAMKQGYTYKLVTRYEDFSGKFVDHCHILDHEDQGMMEQVIIEDPAAPPSLERLGFNRISDELLSPKTKATVLLFVKGAACKHCMQQLIEMASKLTEENIEVSVISASTREDLANFPKLPFTLIPDPELKWFKKYRAYSDSRGAQHATVVYDRNGKEVFRNVGEQPLSDVTAVKLALKYPR